VTRQSSVRPHELIENRDAFLARVATMVDDRVRGLSKLASALGDGAAERELRAALTAFDGLNRELRIIARPDEPIPSRRRVLDLVAMLKATFRKHRAQAGARGVSVDVRASGSVIGRWDRGHLTTILFELLSNALKYGRGRDVSVRLRTSGRHVSLIVENEGAWTFRRREADRFQRGYHDEPVHGFGVGLWLTQRLAEAHGGSFRVTSRASTTRTIVVLPFDRRRGGSEPLHVVIRKLAGPA
jgi:signal transduction histidine kinase